MDLTRRMAMRMYVRRLEQPTKDDDKEDNIIRG
jgi:hypothetical protein